MEKKKSIVKLTNYEEILLFIIFRLLLVRNTLTFIFDYYEQQEEKLKFYIC